MTPAGSLTSMAAAIGMAASALVTSPSAAIWKAASVEVIVVRPTFVWVSGLSVALNGVGSAKEWGAAAMRSLRERLTGEAWGASSLLVTCSRGVIPGRATPWMTPVRVGEGATGGIPTTASL